MDGCIDTDWIVATHPKTQVFVRKGTNCADRVRVKRTVCTGDRVLSGATVVRSMSATLGHQRGVFSRAALEQSHVLHVMLTSQFTLQT
jgi:hypothetical protein